MTKVDPAIQDICRRMKITDYLATRGIRILKSGRNWKCCCPLPDHPDDHTPSFNIRDMPDGVQMFKCFGCIPDIQRMPTADGMKAAKDISIGDTLTDVYGHPVTVLAKEEKTTNDIMRMKTSIDRRGILATSNHRMLVLPRPLVKRHIELRTGKETCDRIYEKELRHIEPGDWVPVAIQKPTGMIPKIILQRDLRVREFQEVIPNEDFCWMVGLYCAEGSVSGDRLISFDLHKDETLYVKERLEKALNEFALLDVNIVPQKIRRNGNGQTITVCHAGLARWLSQNCGRGCQNKKMPNCLREAPLRLQACWAAGAFFGDGGGRSVFGITSEDFVDDMYRIALMCGSIPSRYKVRRTKGKKLVHTMRFNYFSLEDLIRVSEGGTFYPRVHKNACHVKINGEWVLAVRVEEVRWMNNRKERPVYDFSVSGSSTFSCLYVAVHNCDTGGNIITLTRLMEKIRPRDAIARLARATGVALGERQSFVKQEPLPDEATLAFCTEDMLSRSISRFARTFLANKGSSEDAIDQVCKIYQNVDRLTEEGDEEKLAQVLEALKMKIWRYKGLP